VLSASLYITLCSAKNRVLVRLRRLREPRYLVGAVVGVAYLYFAVISRAGRGNPGRGRRGDNRQPFEIFGSFEMVGTSLAGLGVFLLAVLAWVLPAEAGLLEFSEAETAILLPAPVSRRQLLIHRVVRSQVGSLVASAFIALFAAPFGGPARIRLALSTWVLLVTIRVYYAAVALTKARLQSPLPSVRRGAWLPIGLFAAALVVVVGGIVAQMRPLPASGSDFAVHLARAASAGAVHFVLLPFIAVLRPPFATTTMSFVGALAASFAVLAVTTVWMLLNDVALDLALGHRAERQVEAAAPGATAVRVRETPWKLAPAGRLELALLWKGATQTFRAINLPTWRYLPPIIGATVGVVGAAIGITSGGNMQGPAGFVMALSAIVAGMATLFGPQMMRADLRSDFEHLDLIKTWPVRAGDVIRGEMAWPVAVVSATACTALLVAALFSGAALTSVRFIDRWSVAIAFMLLAPALIAAQYAVHNAATIAFPAWVPLGKQRTRGIDAMGQRLILLAAILVSLVVLALPGAIAAGVVWLIFQRLVGRLVFVPMAIVFAAIVLTEVVVVTELLGPAYERIDVTSVERPE
jgi:ABC-2 type transport system permease protein